MIPMKTSSAIVACLAQQFCSLGVLAQPAITTQPKSHVVDQGFTATFRVVVRGIAPLMYQWKFNNAEVAGATRAVLTLTNAQVANAGIYMVVASDASGSIASQPASLEVPVPAAHSFRSIGVGTDRSITLTLEGTVAAALRPFFDIYRVESSSDLTNWKPLIRLSPGRGRTPGQRAAKAPARHVQPRGRG